MSRTAKEPHSTAGKRFRPENIQKIQERTALVRSLYIQGLRGVEKIARLLGASRMEISEDLYFLEMEGEIPPKSKVSRRRN